MTAPRHSAVQVALLPEQSVRASCSICEWFAAPLLDRDSCTAPCEHPDAVAQGAPLPVVGCAEWCSGYREVAAGETREEAVERHYAAEALKVDPQTDEQVRTAMEAARKRAAGYTAALRRIHAKRSKLRVA